MAFCTKYSTIFIVINILLQWHRVLMAITITSKPSKTKGIRYRAKVNVTGQQHTKTFSTKKAAQKWATQTQTDLNRAKGYDRYDRPFRELTQAYLHDEPKGLDKKKHQLEYWCSRIGYLKMYEITTPIISRETKRLRKQKTSAGKQYAPATVVRYLAALSHCFNWGIEDGWLVTNPASAVTRPTENNKRDRWLNAEELPKLLEATKASRNPQLHNITMLALLTAMRQGEILSAKWEDLSKDNLRIPVTKNKTVRLVPLTAQISEVFNKQQRWASKQPHSSSYIFPRISQQTHQLLDEPIASIRTAWLKAVETAGIPDFRFHDLRHTASSYMVMTGVSGKVTASTMGYLSPDAADRYQHVSEIHHKEALTKMHDNYFANK